MNLEQKKQGLVAELNRVQQKINDYWLLDIAYDSWPLKDLMMKKKEIEYKIREVNEEIERTSLSI